VQKRSSHFEYKALPAVGWGVDANGNSAHDKCITVRRGALRVSTEKSDTVICDLPAEWADGAHVDASKYKDMYASSTATPEESWGCHGKRIDWIDTSTLADSAVVDDLIKNRHSQKAVSK
jgi:hypothetical protein